MPLGLRRCLYAYTCDAITDGFACSTWALWYGEHGLAIFPCHTPTAAGCSCLHKDTCDSPGKHPRITGWQKRATTDPAQIEKWWGTMFPDANIGLACGHTGWVLDVDCSRRTRGDLALEALIDAHGPLPDTPWCIVAVAASIIISAPAHGHHWQ